MKRTASLLLVALAGTAQAAGFENMMNPLGGLSPFGASNPSAPSPFSGMPFGYGGSPFGYGASPFGMGSPFGLGSPLGLGSPFGLGSPLGLGALAAPLGLGLLNPLGGLGGMGMGNAMYPALQVAPNMMSYQHMNQMANPYGGGPFAGNPYLQPSMPNPFSAPAFSPSMPTMPTMPFAAPQQQGNLSGMLPLPQFGYGAAVPMPAPAAPSAMGRTPWSQAPAAPAPQVPAQAALPFALPFLTPPAAQPVPAPAPAAAPSLMPFFPAAAPQPPQATAKPAPAPAPEKAPAAPQAPAAAPPLDPATFMQMFMKPAEGAK